MMIELVEKIITSIQSLVWGPPLLCLLFGTGIYLTWVLRGLQFRRFGYALQQLWQPETRHSDGDISPFSSLMTSLAGAIGTGSIVGVATAIAMGGIGALFWMWVTTLFTMATKYAESVLAVKYREKDHRGEMVGGPMQYIRNGLGWKKIASLFAFLGIFVSIGTGNLVQTNSIAEAVTNIVPISPWIIGVVVAFFTFLVIFRGVRSIGRVVHFLVPGMAILYVTGGLIVLATHYHHIPFALQSIVKAAFQGQAAMGGIAGTSVLWAIQLGVSHSIFSNEAGLGISSISAAAARTDQPCRQGLVIMTGAVISTLIVCSITGLAIVITQSHQVLDSNGSPLNGATLAMHAFQQALPGGKYVVAISLVLFAFSTIIAWAYYGEKCFETFAGEKNIPLFRLFYSFVIIPAALCNVEFIWHMADILNGCIVVPNLIALLALSTVVVQETQVFFRKELQTAQI